jgi:hypothetical protein
LGFLTHLLFWPVTGPTFLTEFALNKVGDSVREELTSDESIKEDLLALQMRLELGEIGDDEYVEMEAELMQRLRDVRHWREQFGMGTSGGPVRVATATPEAGDSEEVEDVEPPEPAGGNPLDPTNPRRGGIASPEGASVEIKFDWE